MPKIIDLTGQKFEKLTVIERDRLPSGAAAWRCKCDCGGERLVGGWGLTNGAAKSCGCVRSKGNTRHGECGSDEWVSWMNMIQRCTNLKNPAYYRYGGRGIEVCERWKKFDNFLEDMGKRPKGLTLDRIDNDKGYFLENCRWATYTTQARNRSVTVILSLGGVSKSLIDWATELNIKASVIHIRLWRGWSVERSLTTPVA